MRHEFKTKVEVFMADGNIGITTVKWICEYEVTEKGLKNFKVSVPNQKVEIEYHDSEEGTCYKFIAIGGKNTDVEINKPIDACRLQPSELEEYSNYRILRFDY